MITLRTLFIRSIFFYRRTNLAVLLGAAVSTAVLVGALLIGDSVRFSLQQMAASRLGRVHLAMTHSDRFHQAGLADELAAELHNDAAAVLRLAGAVSINHPLNSVKNNKRVNHVEILGVDSHFWNLAPKQRIFHLEPDEIILNKPLAAQLAATAGDMVVLRMRKPSPLSGEAPLSVIDDDSVAALLRVKAVISESEFGHFSLKANQVAPYNAFVSLTTLAAKVEQSGRANTILLSNNTKDSLTTDEAAAAIKRHWQLADAALELRELQQQNQLELRSRRIFIEDTILETTSKAKVKSTGILTYLINELRVNNRTTPYSFVSAIEKSRDGSGIIPSDMDDDEIIINNWLAKDLQAKVGDIINLTYFVSGPMRKLAERTSKFRVRAVVPIKGKAADHKLMPDFAGLADVENCRDWRPGVPVNLDAIRTKDEDYWDRYRGTPKAFITLSAGQKLWKNRFGSVTALRWPLTKDSRKIVENTILQKSDPAQLGIFFQPVARQGRQASENALNFGHLFLGLSFFVIVSALLLTGLLFVLGIDHRRTEIGILKALGFSDSRVRLLWLWQAGALAILGAIVGLPCGMAYTWIMLHGLATVWRDAIGSSIIHFHAEPSSLLIGGTAGLITALTAISVTLRHHTRRTARELLSDDTSLQLQKAVTVSNKNNNGLWVGIVCAATAFGVVLAGLYSKDVSAGLFFIAGALLLFSSLGFTAALLNRSGRRAGVSQLTIPSLAVRNLTRRSGRTLAITALLSCGVFIIFSVGANRHDALANAEKRSSGTGGFALTGESTLPIYNDLNSEKTRNKFLLDAKLFQQVKIVHLRVRDGDDASCLNLNQAQMPRLLGVAPEEPDARGAFTFVKTLSGTDWANKHSKTDDNNNTSVSHPWLLLAQKQDDDCIPAIADAATIKWAMGKAIGDKLTFTDDYGRDFKVRLVGALKNSILQGSLVISEQNFVERFPSQDGYRMFLIDCPAENSNKVSQTLSDRLSDKGLDVHTTVQKPGSFNAVQNTYLSIFQLLGGLGLILGSVGLGVVLMRNVLERRGEFAMLRAVGFDKKTLKHLILYEHWISLLAGLICGVGAALMAVLPAVRGAGTQVPWLQLLLTLAVVAVIGIIWIWLAAGAAMKGELLPALSEE